MSTKSVRWMFNFTKWSPTMSDMLLASSCIQKEEKERLSRFVFKKDLKASLIGRLMARKYVSQSTGKKYDQIKLIRDERGRPLVEDDPSVQFNISHQGDFTVFAGEFGDLMLGIDVMKLEYTGGRDLNEFFRIMNRQFSPEEWQEIKRAGDRNEQEKMFCRHWCLKESYTKAMGLGVTATLQEKFKINTKRLSMVDIVDDTELLLKGEKMDWAIQEMLIDEEHCVALTTNKKVDKVIFREITFEELMQDCVPLGPPDEHFARDYFNKRDK
ncbi:unnamed protein product [Acanthoscelides obtectus]|uniref:L-aminoadipate-semialdehyde dehydrogenase-phosphopantetheinyl transferase n=1 Tax=Acanthoscelides obtectus TaxID=200917 RepID=A0A9P0PQ15_ACAOB|nr:unnamed protein product [Acanthoscelides obtectus]CAK1630231.1 L-aminoadipate-semialdehyde dehydrogenase-phosphopantetheinyl transferase [Acanthoscelides obtectus]